jgi:hypothetical protein
MEQSGSRYDLEAYLTRLEKKLEELEASLGLDERADDPIFVQAKPRIDDV